MLDHRDQLCSLLNQLEGEMRRLALWTEQPPTAAALRSTLPFCADTLAFEQWLQWIFLPQMRQLLALDAPLPEACDVAPMVDVSFDEAAVETQELTRLLRSIDQLVNAHPGRHH